MIKIPEYSNLVDMLTQRAQGGGRAVYANFVSDNGQMEGQLTFQELDQDARRIGAALVRRGLKRRNLLLLYMPGFDYVRAFFGCLYAGAVPVPAYPPVGTKDLTRLQKIAEDCGVGAVLASSSVLSQIEGWRVDLPDHDTVPIITTDLIPPGKASARFVPHQAALDDLAFLQYTSGSTGHPRGVMITHGNLLTNFAQILQGFLQDNPLVNWLEDLRSVIWLPPFHDMGLIGGLLTPVFAGAQVTLMAPMTFLKRPHVWLHTIARQGAHISGGPNFAFEHCLNKITEEQMEGLDLSSWKIAFNGAEPVQADVMQRFSARFRRCGFDPAAFFPCYGLAEASLFVAGAPGGRGATSLQADQDHLQRGRFVAAEPTSLYPDVTLVSSGRVAAGTEVRIVQPESRVPCKDGEVGEIWVRGPSVAQGYWAQYQLSAATFQARPTGEESGPAYLRTGDLGFRQQDELYVTGRIKEMIIVTGRNFYPQDIEQALQDSDPAFHGRAGAAFSVIERGRESLVILQEVHRRYNNRSDLQALAVNGARAVAARHGVMPCVVALLPANSIPKTSSGKLQRVDARRLYREGRLAPLHLWQPGIHASAKPMTSRTDSAADGMHRDWRSELCADVRFWVAEKLDVDYHQIDLDVTFVELGVDSVEAVELMERLQERVGRPIPPIELLRYPTVQSLIDHLAEERRRLALLRLEREEEVAALL